MLWFMKEYPWSSRTIPTSYLLPSQWPHPQNDDILLSIQESQFEDKFPRVRFRRQGSLTHNIVGYRIGRQSRYYCQYENLNEIRKTNNNLIVIGKTTAENDKEDYDNDADDDEAEHAEDSEGDDFEQETG